MDVKYINLLLEGTINGEIRDAVGEITNMVSGAARKKIEAMYQPRFLLSFPGRSTR